MCQSSRVFLRQDLEGSSNYLGDIKDMQQLLIAGVLTALTAFCIYTAYITGKSGNMQGAWFFSAFSLLFVIPLVILVIKALAQRNSGFRRFYEKLSGPERKSVRFVPHWFMMLLIFIFTIVVTVNIIRAASRVIKFF